MKRGIKTSALIAASCLAFPTISGASEVVTPLLATHACTAGQWTSENTRDLHSEGYSHLCGGDVGVWYIDSGIGLQNSFVTSTDRYMYVNLYEEDTGLFASDDLCREYGLNFAVVNGIYKPHYVYTDYTNASSIEDDANVELYIKHKVMTISGDTSTAVPWGLTYYKIWAYSN